MAQAPKFNESTLHDSHSALGCLAMLGLSVAVVVLPILYFADILRLPAKPKPLKAGDYQAMKGELSKVSAAARRGAGLVDQTPAEERRRPGGSGGLGKHASEPPWTSYEIVEQQERGSRLVAGRKQAITYAVMLKPRNELLPSKGQLTDLAHSLRSDAHHATYIYFYATGMDPNQGAWVTAHHTPGGAFEMKQFDNMLPARFRP